MRGLWSFVGKAVEEIGELMKKMKQGLVKGYCWRGGDQTPIDASVHS